MVPQIVKRRIGTTDGLTGMSGEDQRMKEREACPVQGKREKT
jgi:hypothetical protein